MQRMIQKLSQDYLFLFTTALVLVAACFGVLDWAAISWPTVISLLSLLGMVSLYQSLGLIDALADFFIKKAKTTRSLILAIFLLTFFSSMLVTNDVAILTFLPLTFALVKKVTLPTIKVTVFITIYANLGSAVSPIGNPQNIFLLAHYQRTFLSMLPPASLMLFLGLVSMPIFLLLMPNENIQPIKQQAWIKPMPKLEKFLLGTGTVIVLGDLIIQTNLLSALALVLILIFFYDRRVLKEVDYGVVLSIMNFFLLVSGWITIPAVHHLLQHLGSQNLSLFLTGLLTSQLISNVPAAALLAPMTEHFTALYLAVSIGGFGTLIASLANLLAYRQVKAAATSKNQFSFIKTFTITNFLFLLVGAGLASLFLLF
ncbi:carboxylate transporter [Fructobacillus sp. M1-13]|uniref:Carboxylate transporter n=1 Tax=Fructobacillus papyriferae TaxID=2713171 RepID=A0ABS5QNF0_9LACO|nr:SLC13 family permease [Fructobacillus papyriferae]MBS9334630.1 carboxylate transporter [Fructobacillus papyriferae]MCD2158620.1 carboxylate transporter [Fructobacillus papyriferae]